ncbi:MAG: NDP-sugar synthase [Canidatus Methanoxibalbensis ujae]|nr:NDP-sugar synthase [Candidatus Methanoxibalbensis ujae]
MKAVILAGGLGTRLRPLTLTTPKPLIPIVNKPAIGHIVEYLTRHGFSDIIVTTNYQQERLKSYLSENYRNIHFYFPEEPHPLGTAGSVKNSSLNDTAFIIQGDNITDIDVKKIISFHRSHGGLVTIALMHVENPSQFGVAEVDECGRILRFVEKPVKYFSDLASIGLYVIEPEALEYVPEGKPFDFAKDLFPIILEQEELYGCVVDGFWTDIGTFEGYRKAHEWILQRMKSDMKCDNTDSSVKRSEIDGFVVIGNDSIIENSEIHGFVSIGDNVHVKNCKIHDSVIFNYARIRESVIKVSIIAEKCVVKCGKIEQSVVGAFSYLENTRLINEKIAPPVIMR